jgi:ornithine--oxo-acid transaminase
VNQVCSPSFWKTKPLTVLLDGVYHQGHCHPKIVATLIAQSQRLTLSSRAFYSSVFGRYAKFVTEMFGYEMVLPMNTGAEAVETAIKLVRKWAHLKKGVPEGQSLILCPQGNFHGRTMAAVRCVLFRLSQVGL